METLDRYCEECGAANSLEAANCFACSRPLTALAPDQSPDFPSATSEPEQLPAVPFAMAASDAYVQITLKENAQATIQLVQAPAPTPEPLLHGRYSVLGQVGTGGFGAVYKARDLQARGRMVAIKAIQLDTLSASQAIEATDTFNRELSLLSSLDHPHLPTIYEHFIDETHWYLVMDFIDGEPLDEYLQQMQLSCLPLKQVVNIGLQLCDVLRYLHQLQPPVIFRDLKPANIMRTPGGRLYLIDFGIARRFKPGQTRDTTPLGSPGFASPEQYGRAQTTPRSDIYSLGATLYFLLTGYDPTNTPFHLPPIRSLCPTLPEPVAELITSMLALDPAERPENIAAVQHTLSNYGLSTRHTRVLAQSQAFAAVSSNPAPTPQPTQPPARRFKQLLKGLFSIAMTCLVLAACTLTAHFMGLASLNGTNDSSSNPVVAPPIPQQVRMPYIGHLDSLNPYTTSDPQAAGLESLLFGRLVKIGDNLSAQPGFARSWEVSADNLRWTFHLDTRSIFSDGAPISAQDVAASLNYALTSPAAPTTCPFFSLVRDAGELQTHQRSTLLGDSISVIDAATLSLTLTRPAAYLPATLATPCGSILKKSDLDTWHAGGFPASFMQMAFSGTYTLSGYGQSVSGLELSLRSLYPNGAVTPIGLTVQSYPDVNASYKAYLAGQLDISPVADGASDQDLAIKFTTPLTLHYYGMNYLAKPFDSIAIRQAFALALDKDILAGISQGTPTSSLLGGGYDSAANSNPLEARQLFQMGLKEEGWKSASQLPTITFTYQAGQPKLALEAAQAQQMWETTFGIKVVLRASKHLDQEIEATRGNASLQLWAADYTPAYLDPYALVGLPFASGSPLNAVNYGQNTSAHTGQQQALQQSLSASMVASISNSQRQGTYEDADQALMSDVAWLPIYLVSYPYKVRAESVYIFFDQWSPWETRNDCSLLPLC